MSKPSKRGADWAPRGNCRLSPVPFKLLRAIGRNGEEYVAGPEYGEYTGCPFDPWQRGDLVALSFKHTSWHQGEGHKSYETWHIGRRATVPSAPAEKVDCGGTSLFRVDKGSGATLYRIPYQYQHRAAQIIGQPFDSREALELAMDPISQEVAA